MPAATLRSPTVRDVPAIVAALRPHVLAERMLPRSERQVAERLRDYVLAEVVDEDGAPVMVGVGSISLVDLHLAEIGALAADDPEVEAQLVACLLDRVQALGVSDAFLMTDAPARFEALGFRRTPLAELPEKRDRQCLRCSRLPRCRQVALTIAVGGADERLRAAK